MAKANRERAGERRSASKRSLWLLHLLLMVVGAGAYLFLQEGGQPPPPRRPQAKKVKKTPPALAAASRPQPVRSVTISPLPREPESKKERFLQNWS